MLTVVKETVFDKKDKLKEFFEDLVDYAHSEIEENGKDVDNEVKLTLIVNEHEKEIEALNRGTNTREEFYDFKQFCIERFESIDVEIKELRSLIKGLYGFSAIGFAVLGLIIKS